jgi:hypothetical protein
LQRIPAKINNIVFVDDKVKNLEHVAAYATANNLAYTGLRYGAQDHKLHQVDLQVAAIQTELLDNIISDEEAALIAKHRQQRQVGSGR